MPYLIVLLLVPTLVLAGAPTNFPAAYSTNGLTLNQVGTAHLKWAGMLSLYDAALYLAPDAPPARVLEDVPKRLEIVYLRGLSRDILIEAGGKALARHLTPAELAPLRERVARIDALYQDVKAGDRYTLTYLPGVGTELARNGAHQGLIPGADFASAYFAIWLGPRCPRPDVRDALLGGGRK